MSGPPAASRPRVGISLGDPSGIGPEVVDRALASPAVRRALVPVVFGDGPTFERLPAIRKLPPVTPGETLPPEGPARVAVTALAAKDRVPGKPSRPGGKAQLAYVRAAVDAALRGQLDALCTAPVSKEQITRAGVRFMGHTELLAQAFGREVLMLMDGPRVKVALATNHLALRDVPRALDKVRLAAQLQLLSASLQPVLGRRPRSAVCGVNPHAGEGGLLGDEEVRTIAPAIALARKRGVDCTGPWPADGLFARPDHMPADVVLAMYHDQALVVAKALDFDATVNVTLGLPVPRTSPDHGVAYDLAGKGRASAGPMVAALLKAAQLAAPRGRASARAASAPRRRA
ncbi:MAG TPA: 4-hydroxythreonine-4-phosphate dehydrogenase PdxA [Myxococcaceae bacterium]|nr:4-hydroxythreonine-4-phosphate dehydrogenase PdxA [Myxococcaceae bacterium]